MKRENIICFSDCIVANECGTKWVRIKIKQGLNLIMIWLISVIFYNLGEKTIGAAWKVKIAGKICVKLKG